MKNNTIFAGYAFITPFVILFLLFSLFPMLFSIGVSVLKWNGISSAQFVGLQNYIKLFSDPIFRHAFLVTLLLIVPAIPLQIGIGLVLAFILREYWRKTIPIVRVLNFLPYLTASIAIGILFEFFFDEQVGLLNRFLLNIGLIEVSIHWLTDIVLAKIVIILLLVWRYFGYMMLIIIAGLQTIPDSLFEAARIDGAQWHQRLFYITVPMLRPVLLFLSVMSIIGGLQLFAEPVAIMKFAHLPFGGVRKSVLTLLMYFYDISFRDFRFGYGATIAVVILIVTFLLSFITIWLGKQKH